MAENYHPIYHFINHLIPIWTPILILALHSI